MAAFLSGCATVRARRDEGIFCLSSHLANRSRSSSTAADADMAGIPNTVASSNFARSLKGCGGSTSPLLHTLDIRSAGKGCRNDLS